MLLRGCFYPDGLPVRESSSRTTQGAFDGVHELIEEEINMLQPRDGQWTVPSVCFVTLA